MDARNIDFVIEVYRLQGSDYQVLEYMYRFIPVGSTVNTFKRKPDFVFYGKFKQGRNLPLDSPVQSYFIRP